MLADMSGLSADPAAESEVSVPVGTLTNVVTIRDDAPPYALVDVLADSLSRIGATHVVVHLASHDGERLVGLAAGDRAAHSVINVDGSLPGRVYAEQRQTEVGVDDGVRMLIPLSERAYRIGVLELRFPSVDQDIRRSAAEHAVLVAHLLITDGRYTDYYLRARRLEPMMLPAELQWQLLPPRAMGFGGVSVAGMLVPAYDVGGDLFDYSGEPDLIHLAVFDVMGHGIVSAVLSGLVAGAYRNARRVGASLQECARAVDQGLRSFGMDLFTTGIIAHVDPARGRLSYVNYAHADPFLLRDGQVHWLEPSSRALPMGLSEVECAAEDAEVQMLELRSGDVVVFHTDGATEIRDQRGVPLDDEGFAELVQRQAAIIDEPWELTRRIAAELMDYRKSDLVDDATITVLRYAPEG
jgi:phosphoserine phosphatase RsbU/P